MVHNSACPETHHGSQKAQGHLLSKLTNTHPDSKKSNLLLFYTHGHILLFYVLAKAK